MYNKKPLILLYISLVKLAIDMTDTIGTLVGVGLA